MIIGVILLLSFSDFPVASDCDDQTEKLFGTVTANFVQGVFVLKVILK